VYQLSVRLTFSCTVYLLLSSSSHVQGMVRALFLIRVVADFRAWWTFLVSLYARHSLGHGAVGILCVCVCVCVYVWQGGTLRVCIRQELS